jgi:hypothetical protein
MHSADLQTLQVCTVPIQLKFLDVRKSQYRNRDIRELVPAHIEGAQAGEAWGPVVDRCDLIVTQGEA